MQYKTMSCLCFNTQPPEGGWQNRQGGIRKDCASFNTQPPEGGWGKYDVAVGNDCRFNTQPPEGGWAKAGNKHLLLIVSTHSRLKAAGCGTGGVR